MGETTIIESPTSRGDGPPRATIGDGFELKISGKSRWGIEPGMRVWVGGHDIEARREIERHLDGTPRPPTGSIDKAFIAPQSVDEAVHFARKLLTRLVPDGSIWVVYARKLLEVSEPGHVDPSKASFVSECPSSTITPGELHKAMQDLDLTPSEPCDLGDTFSAIIYDRPHGG